MCWPEADEPYENFTTAMETFKSELRQILVFDQSSKGKYIKVHEEDSSCTILYVYCQRQTNNLVKVVINYSIGTEEYGKESVDIFAEDAVIKLQLEKLDSVKTMRSNMHKCRHIVHEDQVLVKLKYDL